MDATAIPGATCPAHVDQPISGTCERCGAFLCARCVAQAGGKLRCPACVAREAAEAPANLQAGEIIKAGFALPTSNAARFVPVLVVTFALELVMNLYTDLVSNPAMEREMRDLGKRAGDPSMLLDLYASLGRAMALPILGGMVIGALVIGAIITVTADISESRQRTAAQVWGVAVRRFPSMLAVQVLIFAATMVGMMFCCAPGVGVIGIFAVALPSVVIGERGPFAALGESWLLLKPRFWSALGIQLVGMGALMVVGAGAGALTTTLKFAGTGGLIAAAIVTAAVTTVAMVPLYAMDTVLYLRSRPPVGA